jgi:hypothetical protein
VTAESEVPARRTALIVINVSCLLSPSNTVIRTLQFYNVSVLTCPCARQLYRMESLRPPDSCRTQQLHQEDSLCHVTISMQVRNARGLTSVLVIAQNPSFMHNFSKSWILSAFSCKWERGILHFDVHVTVHHDKCV